MTNTVSNTTEALDHLSEGQMAEIAFALNAIEPGAGAEDHITDTMLQWQFLIGVELFILAALVGAGAALAYLHYTGHLAPMQRFLRKGLTLPKLLLHRS